MSIKDFEYILNKAEDKNFNISKFQNLYLSSLS
jgi:hypothetical protein